MGAQKSTHLRPQTSVTAGTILARAAAHRLVLGRLPDGDPLQRHLCPAAPETARYRLLPQRLAARPQAARQHGRPRAQPVVPGGNRRGQIPDQRRSSRRKMLSELGDGNIPGRLRLGSPPTAPPTSDTSSKPPDPDVAKTDGWSGSAVPADRVHVVGKTAGPAVDPPSLLQPQRMGARRLAASQASAGLSR